MIKTARHTCERPSFRSLRGNRGRGPPARDPTKTQRPLQPSARLLTDQVGLSERKGVAAKQQLTTRATLAGYERTAPRERTTATVATVAVTFLEPCRKARKKTESPKLLENRTKTGSGRVGKS